MEITEKYFFFPSPVSLTAQYMSILCTEGHSYIIELFHAPGSR